jgi:hypothetical protein
MTHHRFVLRLVCLALLSATLVTPVFGQSSSSSLQSAPPPIQDNSFLIEEAYNQEAGVVQHISVFTRTRGTGEWAFSFTQEWPFRSQRHQLSYTVPLQSQGSGLGSGLGDLALNYRYQIGGEGASLFAAPRLSVVLPTGDEARDRGSGATGLQLNLPVSVELSPHAVTHWNAGATITPRARNATGDRATTRAFNAGTSLIWLLRPTLNFMFELAWSRSEAVVGSGQRSATDALVFAPGLRSAINFASGLQIVPGFAVPIGLGPSSGGRAILLYLSFEHPFTESAKP